MGIGKASIDWAVFENEPTAHSSHPIEGLAPFREWRLFGTGMAWSPHPILKPTRFWRNNFQT